METIMTRKFYIAYVSLTAAALLAGVLAFTGVFHNQAKAETVVSAPSIRCFIGNKMDRPDTHMTRGWVCTAERLPIVTN
jgi:hypothetical protein